MPSVSRMFPKKGGEHGRLVPFMGNNFKNDANKFKEQINKGQEVKLNSPDKPKEDYKDK